jgi:hypothetical protein
VNNFSIFEQALQISPPELTENLGQLVMISRRDFSDRESFLCRSTTASLEYACLMIENALLLRTNRNGRVYAGFERLSYFQPIMDRYLRIADVSDSVYLFGQDDWRPPRHPNIRVMTLNSSARLAKECFLLTQATTVDCALIAFEPPEEESESRLGQSLSHWVLKTSNCEVVGQLSNALEHLIDITLAA